jgi:hypothetical protein
MVTSQGGSGTGSSTSMLLSKMNAGGSCVISNFGGTSESVTIDFVSIDSTGPYHIARVRVSGPATIPTPTSTPPPTPNPARAPVAPPPNPTPPHTSPMVCTSTGHVVCAIVLLSREYISHGQGFIINLGLGRGCARLWCQRKPSR